jgi:hypothetical protein
MTGSEYIRLLAMLPLGREELRVAVNSPLLRLNNVQWNAFSRPSTTPRSVLSRADTRTTDFYDDSCWN